MDLVAELKQLNLTDEPRTAAYFEHVLAEKSKPPKHPFTPEHTAECKEWLSWAEGHQFLRVTKAPVPAGILPESYRDGQLIDVRVNPRGKIRTDDAVYESDELVRARVARGNSFLAATVGGARQIVCLVQALKKFTGGLGDDDDTIEDAMAADADADADDAAWRKYFLEPISAAHHIVAMEKANGEAAHLAAVWCEDRYLIVSGSKNVHLIMRDEEDIKLYTEKRFSVACNVARAVLHGGALHPALLAFLATTRLTATLELLDPTHQHVVRLTPPAYPLFIAWTPTRELLRPNDSLCCVHPAVGVELAERLGLRAVKCKTIPMAELSNHVVEEGEVLYFVNERGGIIGLLKMKAAWYVFIRACREKLKPASRRLKNLMRDKCEDPVEEADKLYKSLERRVAGRFKEIQRWLGVSPEHTARWIELCQRYCQWTLHQQATGVLEQDTVEHQFPVVWEQHLAASGLRDDFCLEFELEKEAAGVALSFGAAEGGPAEGEAAAGSSQGDTGKVLAAAAAGERRASDE